MADKMDTIRDAAAKAAERKAVLSGAIADIKLALPLLERVRVGDLEAGHASGLDTIEAACVRLRASLS